MGTRSVRSAIRQGLGDRRTCALGGLLIALGVGGKLVLLQYANIETVFVASLLAGSLLGRWWTVLVPLGIMMLLEPFEWGVAFPGYAVSVVLGMTFFIATGFLFVGVLGGALKPRVLLRVGSVALLTTVSIPMTIAYDVWTDLGDYYFVFRPMGVSFWTVLANQVPFTLYHLLSSLLFVPLFGTAFLILTHYLTESPQAEPVTGGEDG